MNAWIRESAVGFVLGFLLVWSFWFPGVACGAEVEKYGAVYAVARQDDGKIVLGGNFTLYNGVSCGYLVRLNTDGSVDTNWTAQAEADAPVRTLRIGSDGLYAGGAFTNIGGGTSPHLAKLNTSTGARVTSWTPPVPNDEVTLIVLTNAEVYIAGDFMMLGESSRRYVARLSAADGSFDATWNPSPNGNVFGLVPDLDANVVYLAGNFTYLGSPAVQAAALRRCSADTGTPDLTWTPDVNEAVYAMIAVDPEEGSGEDCLLIGGNFTFNLGAKRGIAMIRKSDGTFLNESSYATVASGYPVAFTEPIYDAAYGNLAYVYAVGQFGTSGGTAPRNVAKIWCISGMVEGGFKPNPNAKVYAAAATTNGAVIGGVFTEVYRYQASPATTVTSVALSVVKLDYQYDGTSGGFGWHAAKDTNFGGKATSDGVVNALAMQTNGALFLGGDFELVNGVPRRNLAHLNTDGSLDDLWQCDIAAHGTNVPVVYAIALGEAELFSHTNLFVGGTFGTVGGFGRNNLTRMNSTNGTPDMNWYPDPNGLVRSLAITGNVLYVGGDFTQISAREQNRLAKLNAATHRADTQFDPNVNGAVRSLAVSEVLGSTYLYVGGDFTEITGTARSRLAKLNGANGYMIGAWDAGVDAPVMSLAVDGTYVYAGGVFTHIGGFAVPRLARVELASAAVDASWTPMPNGSITALLADGADLYAGGCFQSAGSVGVTNLMRLNYTSGEADATWTPGPQHARKASAGVRTLGRHGTNLYLGGDVVSSGGAPAPGLAQVVSLASPVWGVTAERATNSFTLHWGAIVGAERYFLEVASDAGFSEKVPGYISRDVFTNTACVVTNLAMSRTYYARLRSFFSEGYSQYSARLAAATRNAPLVSGWNDATLWLSHSGVHTIQYSPSGDLYLFHSQKDYDNHFMPGAMVVRKRQADAEDMDVFGEPVLIGADRGQGALRSAMTMHFSAGGTNHVVGESGYLCIITQSDDDGETWDAKRGY
ncbi:MAG: delta-60 repeat domain-containing protein, partial [Kiritimatiellae bacterium]|nr:delta-60 repeat domain-containing protein [Kiritimatiellia bacterium]